MIKETLINATEAGARVLLHFFNDKNLAVSHKEGINNLVTEADHASEKAILGTIKSSFPDHFAAVNRRVEEGDISQLAAEKVILGIDHTELGALYLS